MSFSPKPTKNKVNAQYKTIYITDEMAENINNLATRFDTSFNNIVVSILDEFFKNNKE